MNATTDSLARPARVAHQLDAALLLFRLTVALLFVVSGVRKLIGFDATVKMMDGLGLPLPEVTTAIVVLVEVVGGLAVAAGAGVRVAALVLVAYTLAASVLGHAFWNDPAQLYSFLKNLIIAAGLLVLWATGPGRYAPGGRRR